MDFILHGYCGMYCGACPILLVTKAGKSMMVNSATGAKVRNPPDIAPVASRIVLNVKALDSAVNAAN